MRLQFIYTKRLGMSIKLMTIQINNVLEKGENIRTKNTAFVACG